MFNRIKFVNINKVIIVFNFLVYLFTYWNAFNVVYHDECCLFDNSNIEGVIEECDTGTDGSTFTIKGVNYKFKGVEHECKREGCEFNSNDIKNPIRFSDAVEPGDSITKPKQSNSMSVYEEGHECVYILVVHSCCP